MEQSKLEWLYSRQNSHKEELVPLQSNWPDLGRKERPVPNPVWFLDYEGLTVGQSVTEAGAYDLLKVMPSCTIRLYWPTEEDLNQEDEHRRWYNQS